MDHAGHRWLPSGRFCTDVGVAPGHHVLASRVLRIARDRAAALLHLELPGGRRPGAAAHHRDPHRPGRVRTANVGAAFPNPARLRHRQGPQGRHGGMHRVSAVARNVLRRSDARPRCRPAAPGGSAARRAGDVLPGQDRHHLSLSPAQYDRPANRLGRVLGSQAAARTGAGKESAAPARASGARLDGLHRRHPGAVGTAVGDGRRQPGPRAACDARGRRGVGRLLQRSGSRFCAVGDAGP